MAAKLSGGTAAAGVVAYQDSEVPDQFHYLPANAETILNETLRDFSATYWGIGEEYLYQAPDGRIESIVGAILAGRVAIDISQFQRDRIINAIRLAYKQQNPRLIPMMLTDVEVQPIVGTNTLRLGKDSDVTFPKTVQLGTTFNFLVGTGNSLFAQFVGSQAMGDVVTPNPSFGINIYGNAEFQGDPWKVKITADLSQVWSYTRKQFNLDIGWGWFKIASAKLDEIVMNMHRDQIIKLDMIEGSLDNEKYGRQILEMGKTLYEQINSLALSQEGFFKFEPNPTPATADNPSSGFSWPWNGYINGGYSEQSIKSTQSTHYEAELSYTGRLTRRVPASMTLAVSCNSATASYYRDLGEPSQPCITDPKAARMQERLKAERDKKTALADRLFDRWIMGEITDDQYYVGMNRLYGFSATESAVIMEQPDTVKFDGREYKLPGNRVVFGFREGDFNTLFETAKGRSAG